MGSHILDMGPVHVRGAIRARFARVLWQDGTLYVVWRQNGGVQRLTAATTEPVAPAVTSGFWRATTEEGQSVSWSAKGCATCGSPYKGLGKVPQSDIIQGLV